MIVTLYTKPGCGLCDEVRDVIEQVRAEVPFDVDVRDILQDLADFQRYKHDIPIVLLNGQEIARHRMSAEQLRASLRAASV